MNRCFTCSLRPSCLDPTARKNNAVECPMIVLTKWSIGSYRCLCTHDMRVFCANCCVCRDQEVSCRLLTAEDRTRYSGSPFGVCVKQSRNRIYSVRYLPFPVSMIIPQTFHIHSSAIQGIDNNPVRGLRSTFRQPQYALRLKEIIRLLTKIL
jgi:hypothetical protein